MTTPDGVALCLVDTAGVLARSHGAAPAPDASAPAQALLRAGTMRAVKRADVAVLVVDCPANSGAGDAAAGRKVAPPPPGPGVRAGGEGRRQPDAPPAAQQRGGDAQAVRALGGERGGLLSHEQGLLR